MKKIILMLALTVSFVGVIHAQADGKSIGLRLGYPTEISFQTGLNDLNRIELGLGIRTNSYGINSHYAEFNLSGVYQWVWDLKALADGFNWYAGAGASVGYYSYSYLNFSYSGYPVSILGQVGIEYNFKDIPLRLSLDYRPGVQLNANGSGFVAGEFGIAGRYRF